MTEISKMKDREILELILTNQISLAQEINKIKAVAHSQSSTVYSEAYKSKLDIFNELLNDSEDFSREFRSEKES